MFVIEERDFQEFAAYIRSNYGIHLKSAKKTLVQGRLGPLLARLNMTSLREYMDYVQADTTGQAATLMLNRLTTNYTFFMREPEHFRYFKRVVLPYLERTVEDKDLRIWSAACSTGEEPYTLAMIIAEYFSLQRDSWDTKILATDISQKALAFARTGIYDNGEVATLPKAWQRRYFKPYDANRSILIERIRNEVIFANINLMKTPFPFKKKMHVIFCRNVMIYFDTETKENLAERLYDITVPGGFLFIGHSEGLNRTKTRYKYVMPAVYRKE